MEKTTVILHDLSVKLYCAFEAIDLFLEYLSFC